MKYFKESVLAVCATLLVACSADDNITEEISVPAKPMTFTATLGNETRTSLSNDAINPYPVWSANDKIMVLNASAENSTALFDVDANDVGKRAASFTGTIDIFRDNGKEVPNSFYALYAGSFEGVGAPTIKANGSTVTVSGNIPYVQSATGFQANYHFMTACTTGTSFRFKNAMSLLKIHIAENNYENFQIRRAYIVSNDGKPIAGNFTADFKSGGDGLLENYNITNGSDRITLCDGTKLAVGTYYVAVLPGASGFTLRFEDDSNDNFKEFELKSTVAITASQEINLGSFSAKGTAKEAYVDLGLNAKWCFENVYDDESDKKSDRDASYYAWGEKYVKANQTRNSDTYRTYSWYYNYRIGEGSEDASAAGKRCYEYGVGASNWLAFTASESYSFIYKPISITYTGVLLKYNRSSDYRRAAADWGGGTIDSYTELQTTDDAAFMKAPHHITRIPTVANFEELLNSQKLEITKEGNNYKIQNKDTKRYITLPIGGFRFKSSSRASDDPQSTTVATYWARDFNPSSDANSYKAKSFVYPKVDNANIVEVERCQGRFLRGVVETNRPRSAN